MAKKKETGLTPLIEEAVRRLKLAREASEENRKRAKEAIKFRDLDQWPAEIKAARENDPDGARPCLTLDKINQYINQVKNDERQNRPSTKIRPVDDEGDIKVAEIYQGIIRDIEDCSSADAAYDTGFEHAADGGFGYWRIVTEYADEMSFDQSPRIKRISNRFSVALDPHYLEADGSDRRWGFVFESLPKEEFERKYPDAKPVSFSDYGDKAPEWCGENVLIAEYFRLEETSVEIALLKDGSVVELDQVPVGQVPVQTRQTTKTVCKWSKLTCAEELDKQDFPSRYIPIVEVVGNEIDDEGKRKLSGMVRGAMDSMRMYNYGASSFVENVALAPKVPYIGAEGQFEGREDVWSQANRRNISALTYKPVIEGGLLVPPPRREQMVGIPMGWQQVMTNMEHDVQTSMGMYASNLGEQTDATSGKQEMALQRRGDTATFHFVDNLSRSIRFSGRILVDMIPRLFDTARLTRILKEDGKPDMVRLDPDQEEAIKTIAGADGKSVNYYNLSKGKYDVTVSAGPGYSTRRVEAAEFLTNAINSAKDPITAQVLTYLAMKTSDWAGAEEATKMMKILLPPQLQDQGEGANLPPEVADAIRQAQAQIQQREQMLQQKEQGLAQVGDVANQEIQQAKDAKSELEKERIQLNADKQVLAATTKAASAGIELDYLKAEKQLQDMMAAHKTEMDQAEQDHQEVHGKDAQESAVSQQLLKNQQQFMDAIQAVLTAIAAPRIKKSRVTSPTGGVYEHESVESLAPETVQ